MTFHVGQKVVCINDQADDQWDGETVPVKGVVYTIREIGEGLAHYGGPDGPLIPNLGFRLEEIRNPKLRKLNHEPIEVWFAWQQFRPVQTTDISVFEAMLKPIQIPETISK